MVVSVMQSLDHKSLICLHILDKYKLTKNNLITEEKLLITYSIS